MIKLKVYITGDSDPVIHETNTPIIDSRNITHDGLKIVDGKRYTIYPPHVIQRIEWDESEAQG